MARLLLDRGGPVLRLNLRGAGPSRPLCGQHYYAGRSQDFRALLSLLPDELTRDGVMAVGYSLGGAMLLKYLGEEGAASPLAAAATVSAPIDLAVTCRHMMRPRNRLYHHYILEPDEGRGDGRGRRRLGRRARRHHGRAHGVGLRRRLHRPALRLRQRRGLLRALPADAVHGRHPRARR